MPLAAMRVRSATEADARRVSSLIHCLSKPFMLSPDGTGAELFLESISEQAIHGYIAGNRFLYLVSEVEDQLVAVAALRDNSHLYHLFVAPAYQGKGLGRRLWLLVKDAGLRAGNTGRFTVNSSLNAVAVYERFGFVATGPRVEKHGVAFVPMQLAASENGGQPFGQLK